ncbi:uncharacterized protein LOC141507241 [Macrotis lagotis]|uniref:uncharacterized protein LOC141507241 n=1 Tax=Macrotis lagotis TaxID=92651 RepID=UPI003D680FDA
MLPAEGGWGRHRREPRLGAAAATQNGGGPGGSGSENVSVPNRCVVRNERGGGETLGKGAGPGGTAAPDWRSGGPGGRRPSPRPTSPAPRLLPRRLQPVAGPFATVGRKRGLSSLAGSYETVRSCVAITTRSERPVRPPRLQPSGLAEPVWELRGRVPAPLRGRAARFGLLLGHRRARGGEGREAPGAGCPHGPKRETDGRSRPKWSRGGGGAVGPGGQGLRHRSEGRELRRIAPRGLLRLLDRRVSAREKRTTETPPPPRPRNAASSRTWKHYFPPFRAETSLSWVREESLGPPGLPSLPRAHCLPLASLFPLQSYNASERKLLCCSPKRQGSFQDCILGESHVVISLPFPSSGAGNRNPKVRREGGGEAPLSLKVTPGLELISFMSLLKFRVSPAKLPYIPPPPPPSETKGSVTDKKGFHK